METNEEFQVSKSLLKEWFKSLRCSPDEDVIANSVILEEFLERDIMHHKSRWFLPERDGRMTLDNKTTSILENVNSTMKTKCIKRVQPNMSLLTSYMTQDFQVNARMEELVHQVHRDFISTPTWAHTNTSRDVTKVAESWNQQQWEQSQYYAARVEHESLILIKRRSDAPPTGKIACEECRPEHAFCCPEHSNHSPIPRFQRVRKLEMIKLDEDCWMLKCSCLFHPSTGVPCRHT